MSCAVRTPFRLDTLSQHAFPHAGWIRTERQALLSVANKERLLVLGQPGTGKSLLLRCLNRTLTSQGVSVRRFNSGDPLDDLATRDVVLVDEAASLSVTEAEQLSHLRNPVIMFGLPNLPERLSLQPDAFNAVTLEPLAPEEVARFIIARLLESGRPRTMFTPEALIAVARQSSGLMRLVIVLAGAATFFAEQRGAANVTVDDVAEAVSMRSFKPDALGQPAAVDKRLQREPAVSRTIEIKTRWLGPAAVRGWHWNRIAGTGAFVCVSLMMIGVTVMAALHVDATSSLALGDVQGRSMPPTASSALPGVPVSPAGQLTPAAPVQVATASPPLQADTTSSPAVTPRPLPEAAWSKAPTSQLEVANTDAPVLSARPSPPVGRAETSATTLAFYGPILNETMGQSGRLSLQLRMHGTRGPVDAVFHDSTGLIGSGVLTGDIGDDGQITLSGRLMMGQNPFDCALKGTLKGEYLVGAATFVRANSRVAAHSRFTLSRL